MAEGQDTDGFEAKLSINKKEKNIVQAEIKVSKNGSYTLSIDSKMSLNIEVNVQPCRCRSQGNPSGSTNQIAGMSNHVTPFMNENSPNRDQEQRGDGDNIHHGLEESVEVDPEKSRLVCSADFTTNYNTRNTRRK